MTYREAPLREPIEPPWGRVSTLGRRAAYGVFGTGAAGAVALLALGNPILALGAIIATSGMGLSFLFGGGGEPEGSQTAVGRVGESLRGAGLQPVGWTEWRAIRDGFPVRVIYSALSARVRIEVALGSVPTFELEVEAPAPVGAPGEVVPTGGEPVLVRSDQLLLARPVVTAALRRIGEAPAAFALRLVDRVLQTRLDRAQSPSGYEAVLGALDLTLGIASGITQIGQGLPPFRRG